jgi:enamine deaminase RidA (YjgF/YER057c/UK114 family)
MKMDRQNVSSGTIWEGIVGYSRAVRVGPFIYVAGTTATDDDGNVVGQDDPGIQTDYIIQKIQRALADAGGSLVDVVRTRIYVTNADDWEAIGRVHGRYFADVRPANALVEVSRLVGSEYLVEIEADAVLRTTDG